MNMDLRMEEEGVGGCRGGQSVTQRDSVCAVVCTVSFRSRALALCQSSCL